MHRRTLLRFASACCALGIGGCLESSEDKQPTQTDVSTPTTTMDERNDCPPSRVPDNRVYSRSGHGLNLVRDAEDPQVGIVNEDWRVVLREAAMNDTDEAFVMETDFDAQFLLAVQYPKGSSGYGLRVIDVEVTDEEVLGELCIEYPSEEAAGPSDAPTSNVLVRVDAPNGVPTSAVVTIEKRHRQERVTTSTTPRDA